jgi:hypothetical protein
MQTNGGQLAADMADALDRSFPPVPDKIEPPLPHFIDLPIDPPVEWNNCTYDTMHVVEPTNRQMMAAEAAWGQAGNSSNAQILRNFHISLVSQCSGLPRQVIELIPARVSKEAYNFLVRCAGGYPLIG